MIKVKLPHINILQTIKNIPGGLRDAKKSFIEWFTFFILFFVFLFNLVIVGLLRKQSLPAPLRLSLLNVTRKLSTFVSTYDKTGGTGMNRLELFELAFRNMVFKKSRTIITVGGMALGVAAIVFLVSIGYGLQKLVVDRVARLDELRQADVAIQPGSSVKLNDQMLIKLKEISKIKDALPLVGLVAKVNYQGSESDVAVYGVTTDYLKQSAVKTIQGDLFKSNYTSFLHNREEAKVVSTEFVSFTDSEAETVAGASTDITKLSYGDKIKNVTYSIFPNTWLRVRSEPSVNGAILGHTTKMDVTQEGVEYLGGDYDLSEAGKYKQTADGQWLGKWIKGTFTVWNEACSRDKSACDTNSSKQVDGYIAELELLVKNGDEINVLGLEDTTVTESTMSVNEELLDNGSVDDLMFLSKVLQTSESVSKTERKKVQLPESTQKEAVVNQALLKLLGLDGGNSVGKTFDVSYVVTSELLENSQESIQSEPVPYKIVGVVLGDDTPFFYVPLADLTSLSVQNFSQIRIVVDIPDSLKKVREKIEALGFVTNSVADTVNQINKLFATLRFVLAIIGSVALGVASLGMFNTLTVSLLERTREVGLMKAMGMTSIEVKRLFLTESMLMGFMGGVLGILTGFLSGKLISLVVSVLGVIKGVGFINISYLPPSFVALVFGLSVFVGLITGYYPSRRATKISALDALRYE